MNRAQLRISIALSYFTKWLPTWLIKIICGDYMRLLRTYFVLSFLAYFTSCSTNELLKAFSTEWQSTVKILVVIPALLHCIKTLLVIKSISWAKKRVVNTYLAQVAWGNTYVIIETFILAVASVRPMIGSWLILTSLAILEYVKSNSKEYRQ